jgi:hypothetical protein
MMGEFNRAELHMISQIRKAAKTLPEDFWGVAAVQELACLLAKLEPLLNGKQMATLIGVGAVLSREADKELTAEIQAAMLFKKIRHTPTGETK